MDKLAFLDGDAPAEPAVVAPVAEAVPVAEPAPDPVADAPQGGPARGADGKFVAKADGYAAPAAEAATADAEAPAAGPEPAPASPASATEPDELTRLREENARLTAQRDGLNKALTQERGIRRAVASHAPDPEADPDGYEAHQEQAGREQALTFEWSFKALSLVQGEEVAKKVMAWAGDLADADPSWYQRALTSPDPAGFAFAEYQRDEAMKMLLEPQFRENFTAYLAAKTNPAPSPAPPVAVAPPTTPSTPPKSLAAALNAGGTKPAAQPVGPSAAFDAVFR